MRSHSSKFPSTRTIRSSYYRKLKSLAWSAGPAYIQFSTLFIHPDLKDLSLFFLSEELDGPELAVRVMSRDAMLPVYKRLVANDGPRLKTLSLLGDLSQFTLAEIASIVVRLSPSLRQLVLPYSSFSNGLLREIAALPHLESLTFDARGLMMGWEGETVGTLDCVPVKLQDEIENPLPSIQALSLVVNPSLNLDGWLSVVAAGSQLSKLELVNIACLMPSMLKNTLEFLASGLRNLNRLTLDAQQYRIRSETGHYYEYETISPLLKFKNLVQFELFLNIPLSITDTDAYALASGWPTLRVLHLNQAPLNRGTRWRRRKDSCQSRHFVYSQLAAEDSPLLAFSSTLVLLAYLFQNCKVAHPAFIQSSNSSILGHLTLMRRRFVIRRLCSRRCSSQITI